ncbi:hypothetical protein IEQ11_23385 [Lysobacter capsici]|nr:hypothetical protein IEQ11_23385 [Lysobacter capsici]
MAGDGDGLVAAAGAFAGMRGAGAARDGAPARAGVVSMRLGAAEAGGAGICTPAGGATLGVAAARAIAAAGDSRSCGGGGRSGSLGVGLGGGAGAGRNGKAVVVAGNADAGGRVSVARVDEAFVAGGVCCAPAEPAASNSPPTTPAAPMARIQRLDFMVPPTLRPEPRASAFRTRSRTMPTERRRAECKRGNR